MYRLEPLTNWKLHIVITTMLKNTTAGKAVIRPVNTSNGEIITILNL